MIKRPTDEQIQALSAEAASHAAEVR